MIEEELGADTDGIVDGDGGELPEQVGHSRLEELPTCPVCRVSGLKRDMVERPRPTKHAIPYSTSRTTRFRAVFLSL